MPQDLDERLFTFRPFEITEVKHRGTECPKPRSGHRIACDEDNIYCFGGYNPNLSESEVLWEGNATWSPDRPLFKELWSYSISNREWKQHKVVENMPDELASHAMCMYGKCLMIYGGTGHPFGDKCSNSLIVWHAGEGDAKFKVVEVEGQRPPALYGQAITCNDGQLLTIGGTNGYAYNCDVYRLDLKTMTWEPLFFGKGEETDPIGRYRHEVACMEDKLYILGGGTGDGAFGLNNIPTFDLTTRSWSEKVTTSDSCMSRPRKPSGRKCHSAVQMNTPDGVQVYITGGFNNNVVFTDLWRLNLKTLTWTFMQKSFLPVPLFFHSSTVTSQGCMYIFGGIEPLPATAVRTNTLYKVWLCVPKLSEMSWEAILHYRPNLGKSSRNILLKSGIPQRFVDRVKGV